VTGCVVATCLSRANERDEFEALEALFGYVEAHPVQQWKSTGKVQSHQLIRTAIKEVTAPEGCDGRAQGKRTLIALQKRPELLIHYKRVDQHS